MCTKYDNECFECESNINFFPYFFLVSPIVLCVPIKQKLTFFPIIDADLDVVTIFEPYRYGISSNDSFVVTQK